MTPEQIRAAFAARQKAVAELRSLADEAEGREFTAEERETEDKLNADIGLLGERIDAGLGELEKRHNEDTQTERFDKLVEAGTVETRDTDPETAAQDDADTIRRLARGEIRSAEFTPATAEVRDLTAGTATDGAELVPTTLFGRVHEHLIELSTVMQANATVITTAGGEDLVVPKTTSFSAAAIVAEAGTITESDPQWTTVTLGAYKYGFLTQVSSELLQDSQFDVVEFLARQGGRALGNGIGAHLVSGTGSGQPAGIDTATTGVTAADAAVITTDELIDLQHSVLSPYRQSAAWIMNDSTVQHIRKKKDADGNYIWRPGASSLAQRTPSSGLRSSMTPTWPPPLPASPQSSMATSAATTSATPDRSGSSEATTTPSPTTW